jgi:iron complex outermembrane receptor protein
MIRDGYLENLSQIGPDDFNNIDYVALRASLVIDITPDLENYTIGSYTHSETNGSVMKMIACGTNGFGPSLACPQLARQAGAPFDSSATILPTQGTELEQWQIINTTTWKASADLTVKNIFSYTEFSDRNDIALFGEKIPHRSDGNSVVWLYHPLRARLQDCR